MRADQIMSRQVTTIGVDATVVDAIKTMLTHRVSTLPVVDQAGKLVGILSETDFIRRAEIGTERKRGRLLTFLAGADRAAIDFRRGHGRKVGQIMTPKPIAIAEDTPVEDIAQIMESHCVKTLPVMRGDEIVGIVAPSDFLPVIKRLARYPEGSGQDDDEIRRALIAAITRAPWAPSGLNVSVGNGIVTLKGVVRSENARQATVVAAENVPGVKQVQSHLFRMADYPPGEEDYGGGDFVSLQEQPSTTDDEPL